MCCKSDGPDLRYTCLKMLKRGLCKARADAAIVVDQRALLIPNGLDLGMVMPGTRVRLRPAGV